MDENEEMGLLLESHEPDVVKTVHALCVLVREACPDATETVQLGWKSVSFSRGGVMKGSICSIGPHKEWVNLQFLQGTSLEDPDGLLEGSGKTMRHVKVRSVEEMDSEALSALVRQADQLVS